MHTNRDGYSSDDFNNSSDKSEFSRTESCSGSDIEAHTLACNADRTVLCTCGCKRRHTLRTAFRDRRKARLRRKRALQGAISIDTGVPDAMDNLRAIEDDGAPIDQMDEAKDQNHD